MYLSICLSVCLSIHLSIHPSIYLFIHYLSLSIRRFTIRSGSCRRKRQPIPVFLPGKSHGQRSLAGYNPWGCKHQAQLSYRGRGGPLSADYQLENRESWWYNPVWVWMPENQGADGVKSFSESKNQDHQCSRVGEDGCLSSSRELIHPSSTFLFSSSAQWIGWCLLTLRRVICSARSLLLQPVMFKGIIDLVWLTTAMFIIVSICCSWHLFPFLSSILFWPFMILTEQVMWFHFLSFLSTSLYFFKKNFFSGFPRGWNIHL